MKHEDMKKSLLHDSRFHVVILCVTHAALLAWSATANSVAFDEYAHLPAGASYLKHREFAIVNTSPPLLRMWAAAPVLLAGAEVPPLEPFAATPLKDRHWTYAEAFMRANAARYQQLFVVARLMMIPISCFGLWIVYRWSRDLYGPAAGLASAGLYALCPNILAHASLVGTDAPIMVAMAAATYFWWRFCAGGKTSMLIAAIAATCAAHLFKFNAVLLWPMFIVIAITARRAATWRMISIAFVVAAFTTFLVFNLGYLFDGTGKSAGSYQLQSKSMAAMMGDLPASLPIPVPEQAILGFDALKWEVEQGYQGFLFGKSYLGSKWYYFPVALALKLPLATIILFVLAIATLQRRRITGDERVVLFTLIAFTLGMALVADVNLGIRYILPVLPFAFIFAGRFFVTRMWRAASMLLIVLVIENLSIAPRYLTFFNLFAGGPSRGQYLLNDSNFDWGQGLLDLKKWMNANDVKRVQLGYFGRVDPSIYGIDYDLITQVSGEPYIAVSSYYLNGLRHRLPSRNGPTGHIQLTFFRQLQRKPRVAIPGGTIHIFRREDVADAMREAAMQGD